MDSLMKYISRIHRCSRRFRHDKIEGLNGQQHIYIFHVCKSNITRQLGLLEQEGFVRRESDPEDRRVLRVYPTNKAEAVLPRVYELMEDWNRLLLEELNQEEQICLLSLLKRITKKAVAAVEPAQTSRSGSTSPV